MKLSSPRSLLASAVAAATLLTFGPASPASADLGPGALDPVINLLGPLPTKHTPYTGSTCPDGAPSCIDATIAEMERRLADSAARCDHDAIFDLAYLRVTEDVRRAVDAGHFSDRVWLGQVDAIFARYYFETMDDWHAGRTAQVPKAWRIALQAADEKRMTGLGNFLLAMNAHINRDFSYVLAEAGLTDASGRSHKADHNAYNPRLDGLYHPVFAEEAARFDPTFDDLDVAMLDELGVGAIMRGWREMVWRNAELLVAAKTPAQRRAVQTLIEGYAATQAQLIRSTFVAGDRGRKRDAWCAVHGQG
ncbi:DUF5995 family protein [Nocardioides daejeonensis]|uniref:DUF5995 family protein n=1 Tax=Nocardioides daejeonensis TaxID=1046556 RepID=UPI0013A59EE0|nr:DUF5995 family protein [Nocardioides daejeonensis]